MLTKSVKFINCWKIYCTGDTATFPVEQANALILGRYAEEIVPQMTKDARHIAEVKNSDEVKAAAKQLNEAKEAPKQPVTEAKAVSKTNDKAVKMTANKAKIAPKKGKK